MKIMIKASKQQLIFFIELFIFDLIDCLELLSDAVYISINITLQDVKVYKRTFKLIKCYFKFFDSNDNLLSTEQKKELKKYKIRSEYLKKTIDLLIKN